MSITRDEIRHVASLAKVAITDAEVDALARELDEILGYVRKLDAVDTTGLTPTYQVTGLQNATRADEVANYGASHAQLMQNVKRSRDGYIEVPKVL